MTCRSLVPSIVCSDVGSIRQAAAGLTLLSHDQTVCRRCREVGPAVSRTVLRNTSIAGRLSPCRWARWIGTRWGNHGIGFKTTSGPTIWHTLACTRPTARPAPTMPSKVKTSSASNRLSGENPAARHAARNRSCADGLRLRRRVIQIRPSSCSGNTPSAVASASDAGTASSNASSQTGSQTSVSTLSGGVCNKPKSISRSSNALNCCAERSD